MRYYFIFINFLGICNPGYQLQGNECVDLNECENNPSLCFGGTCKNTVGSFVCQCPNGFRVNSAHSHCVDIDECKESPNICKNGDCRNTIGSFKSVYYFLFLCNWASILS
jgi:fibulin 1/2